MIMVCYLHHVTIVDGTCRRMNSTFDAGMDILIDSMTMLPSITTSLVVPSALVCPLGRIAVAGYLKDNQGISPRACFQTRARGGWQRCEA